MRQSYCGASMKKAVSDSYLNHWFRKAVLAAYHYRCGLCWQQNQPLEAHHINKRRKVVTRWDWRDGIALCPQCHKLAHTKKGELLIAERHPHYTWLVEMEQVNYKDFRLAAGITDAEFREDMLRKLKEKVAEGDL